MIIMTRNKLKLFIEEEIADGKYEPNLMSGYFPII